MPVIKNPQANAGDTRDEGSIPRSERSIGVGKGKSTPVFLPGKFHAQRNLMGYSPWGCKELDATEHTRMSKERIDGVLNSAQPRSSARVVISNSLRLQRRISLTV